MGRYYIGKLPMTWMPLRKQRDKSLTSGDESFVDHSFSIVAEIPFGSVTVRRTGAARARHTVYS